MPFKSKAQQGFMFAKHPEVAKEMADKTPASAYKHLPDHVSPQHKAAVKALNTSAKRG